MEPTSGFYRFLVVAFLVVTLGCIFGAVFLPAMAGNLTPDQRTCVSGLWAASEGFGGLVLGMLVGKVT